MAELRQLGRYEIVKKLGGMGTGEVYEGLDNKLGRQVAVRVVAKNDAADFMKDAQTLAHLDHPNILTISDFGEEEGIDYLVTEFVSEGRIAQILEGEQVHFRKALGWMVDLLGALEYAHSQGVIHGSITPSNVLVDATGRLKLLDFCLASLLAKCPVLSPEQAGGEIPGKRSDIFAAGTLLYRLLTWKNPFEEEGKFDQEPANIITLNTELPADLDEIVAKALAKKPEERFASAGEFAEALKKFIEQDDIERILEEKAKLESSINEKFTKVITVMFTDLKGSTTIAENEGDLVSRMLIKHQNDIVMPAIRENKGIYVKGIGDGTLSYFEHALDALRAAVRIQAGMDELNMSKKFKTPVLMRIGMHTGKCVVEAKDIFGDVVNTASRFESSADPGMILISEDTYNALSDKSEIYCRFIKQVSLKGKKDMFNAYKAFWNPKEIELDKKGEETLPRQEAAVPVRSSGMKMVWVALAVILGVLILTLGLKFSGSSGSSDKRSISDSIAPAGNGGVTR
jgi:serine/threonine protein kinase